VYAYFNNDQAGAAVLDAAAFTRLTAPRLAVPPVQSQPELP
jgi:uncharacterized protein YecE (DUF72 family)